MKEKDPAAVTMGAKGGKARWAGVSAEDRTKHAKMAVAARYAKKKE